MNDSERAPEAIAAQSFQPTAAPPPPPAAGGAPCGGAGNAVAPRARPAGVSPRTAYALLGLLLAAAVSVPRWLSAPTSTAPGALPEPLTPPPVANASPDPATAAAATEPALAAPPLLLARSAADRSRAQVRLDETLDRRATVATLAGENWAREALAAIDQHLADGEKAYREQRYPAAEDSYRAAQTAIAELAGAVPQALAAARDAGQLALAQGDSATAMSAFERVLELAPGDAVATAGRKRAGSLDAVQALVAQAAGYERMGDTTQALAAYRQALALDAEAPAAGAALTRIEQALRATRLDEALSQAYAARDRRDFGAARAALARAAAIDDNAETLHEAERAIAHAATAAAIAAALARAERAAANERWSEARTAYDAALAEDAELVAARAGRETAARRASLDATVAGYLEHPARLSDAAVHAEASAALASARATGYTAKRLAQHLATLQDSLRLARTPVPVALVSDGATTVALHRYGELGRFDRRALELVPGHYTAVGSRDGYRDVRVEFDLAPAQVGASITVQCTEKIAFGS